MSPIRSGSAAVLDASRRSSSFSASEAKNNFGDVLSLVSEGQTVYITRYNRQRAVVVSAERYHELTGQDAVDLDALTRQFDAQIESMQTPGAAAGIDALFEMDSTALGEAAVRAAQRDDE